MPMTVAEAGSGALPFDREFVRMKGDFALRQSYHDHVARLKAAQLDARRELGARYLAENPEWRAANGNVVSRRTGIGRYNYSGLDVAQAAVSECKALVEARAGGDNPSKGSLEFIGGKRDFGPDSATVRFAFHPSVLCPAIGYFGMLPIFFGAAVCRASADELLGHTSHMFHLDPEDTTMLKVFVHLVDIDEETRPFHALPADLSMKVRLALKYTTQRLRDEQVDDLVGLENVVKGLGPTGAATFCDTTRCFHFGGRPGRNVRDLLILNYILPTNTWYPSEDGDGERRNIMPLLKPSDHSPYWNPLIGATLV